MPIAHRRCGGTVKFGDLLEGVTVGGARRRAHRPVDQGRHRHQGRREAAAHHRSRTPTGNTARLPNGNEARYQLPVGVHLTSYEGQAVSPGRHHREDAARDHQDEGHHRRSAARRRALRGAEAEGVRASSGEIDGARLVRQGHQGQAQGRRHAGSRRRRASTSSPRASTSACTRTITCGPASP